MVSTAELRRFIYDRNTKECFGRTCLGWAQLLAFFAVLYTLLLVYFVLHLVTFLAITPHPSVNTTPWIYGLYAYPNYPNSQIGLVSDPPVILTNGSYSIVSEKRYTSRYVNLLSSAMQVGVASHCLNDTTNYGLSINQPCVFIHVSKVYRWVPEDLHPFVDITIGDALPINCTVESSAKEMGIQVSLSPQTVLLNINNTNGRSFPFQNTVEYIVPVVGVTIDLTGFIVPASSRTALITCGVDLDLLNLAGKSADELSRIYELPANATIQIRFLDRQL